MRVPRGKSEPRIGVQFSITVDIPRIVHQLYSAKGYSPAEHEGKHFVPHRQLLHVERLTGCERIEISGQHVKTASGALNELQYRPYLAHTAAFIIVGMRSPQMYVEDAN